MSDESPASGASSEEEPDGETTGRRWTVPDLRRGALAGVAAYLGGYALVFLWFLTQGRLGSDFVGWRWMGWMFYQGHFAGLATAAGDATAGAASVVESSLGALENVIPSAVLVFATVAGTGFFLAREGADGETGGTDGTAEAEGTADTDAVGDADVDDRVAAATDGASLVVGYLPLAVLGVVVFAGTLPNGVEVRPDPLTGVLVAGLLYPLVVGALGGLAFHYWTHRDAGEADTAASDETDGTEART